MKWVGIMVALGLGSVVALAEISIPTPQMPEPVTCPEASSRTYPDEQGFRNRAIRVINALATNDLETWRKGYFTGGDPGKYLPGASMAKLMINPDDPEVSHYMNDDRSYKEHYHFAAVNWARFYPLYGNKVLTPETTEKLVAQAKRYGAYLNPSGTENHKTMNMMAANVLPTWLETGLSGKTKEQTLAIAKQQLRDFVKTTYATGNGEWDSSTYWQFTVNGLLNIHDFAQDPETRLIARAGLDWFLAGYALKYRDGFFMAPNQRGFPEKPHGSIADQSGYIWWASHYEPTPTEMKRFLYTLHTITSRYRPSLPLYNIAKKNLPSLPVTLHNTKANYWYGQEVQARPNTYAETLYIAPKYSMGSLWNGHGSQITRFQIVADSPNGGLMFTGGHPRRSDHLGQQIDFGYKDGIGRFDRSAQIHNTWFNLTQAPDDEPIDYSFFAFPVQIVPQSHGRWWVMQAGETFVAVRSIGEPAVLGETDLTDKQKQDNDKARANGKEPKHKPSPIIRIPGRKNGMIVETADTTMYPSLEAFKQALDRTDLRVEGLSINYRTIRGESVTVAPDSGDRLKVSVDGKPQDITTWDAVYSGPYVECKNSVLKIWDGKTGYEVDFTGDLPVYRSFSQ